MRIVRRLLLVGLAFAVAVPSVALAQTQTQSGTMDVSALVLGPPPADPPTIDEPVNGKEFTDKNIAVRGGCIAGLIVRIFENGTFVGSTICQSDGQFALTIDLEPGSNTLTARQYDSANQPSPTSAPVTVTYTPATPVSPVIPPDSTPQTPSGSGSAGPGNLQIDFDYDYLSQNITAGQQFHVPVHFSGGTPPYAVAIEWGDGITTLVSRQNALTFDLEHTYRQRGVYTVKILVTDGDGQKASIEFVLIVGGDTLTFDTPLGVVAFNDLGSALVWLIPVFLIPGILIGSFVLPSPTFSLWDWLKHKKRHKQ